MQFSLIEMVQEILSSMDSDEVNSIDDTVESYAVALILRSVFYDLAVDLGLPEHEGLFELIPSNDPLKPVLMTLPTNVSLLRTVKYNIIDTGETYANYRDLAFKRFEDFLTDQLSLRGSDNVAQMTFSSNGDDFDLMYRTDKQPDFYTTMDDHQLFFDSFDSSVDTTLQKSKTMCMGVIYPSFELVDTFIPDIDPSQFSLLKNRAKVRAFAELKQAPNQEAAGEARRQKVIVQKRKQSITMEAPIFNLPRYGRRGIASTNIPKRLKQGS